jgi:folate-dependent phosphoribosylglycinamide formyltransferase PurN
LELKGRGSSLKGIVDRIEGKIYVIEINGVTTDVHRNKVAAGVKPGHAVELVKGIWMADAKATKQREQKIKQLMDDVWAKE